MDRITIIGMGPLGASIGLGLKRSRVRDIELVGSDADRGLMTKAAQMGAVDRTSGNLRSAVNGAQMVILNVSIGKMKELLEAIGPILEDGCVVTDTGVTKVPVLGWAEDYLSAGASFVGGRPLLKSSPREMEDADGSIFRNTDYCIMPSKSADEAAVRTVVGLVEALGAKPVFLDPHEHDSYSAAMTHLPTVLSSAFVTATSQTQGWREMHRLAASDYGDFSRLASNNPVDNEAACLASSEALVHWLDQIIGELYSYRNQIKGRSDTLLDTFIGAWEARAKWEANAVVPDEGTRIPSAGDTLAASFISHRMVDRYKNIKQTYDSRPGWQFRRKP